MLRLSFTYRLVRIQLDCAVVAHSASKEGTAALWDNNADAVFATAAVAACNKHAKRSPQVLLGAFAVTSDAILLHPSIVLRLLFGQ